MFVHYSGTVEQFKQLSNLSDYANKIVFIKGGADGKGAAIYTHGEYYANIAEVSELASELNNLKIIKGVKVGTETRIAADHNGLIEFSADGNATVSVYATSTGIQIGLSNEIITKINNADTQAHTHANKNILDGIKSSDIDNWNDAYNKRHEHVNKAILDGISQQKIDQWDAAQPNVIETVKVNGTALEVSDKSVNVVIPAATVTGVKDGDKILKLNGTELTASISFCKETIEGKEYLVVKGLDGQELGKVDTAEFTADSFLDDVVFDAEKDTIEFTWKMADGSTKTDSVNIAKYIDTYAAGNGLDLNNKTFSVKLDTDNEDDFLTVSEKGLKLSGVQTAINSAVAAKNVTAKGDNYVSASAAGNEVTVSATDSTKAAIALAESALQEIVASGDDYVSLTDSDKSEDHKQTIVAGIKVTTVAGATKLKEGLADAYDVQQEVKGTKDYADSLFAWEEL